MPTEVETPSVVEYQQLIELARKRRSIRYIDANRDVSEDAVTKILEAARLAPSAGNAQPWEFVVIRDRETREYIATLYAKQMAEKREIQRAVYGRTTKSAHLGYTGFRHAPVYILQICDTRVKAAFPIRTMIERGDRHLVSSMALASCLMHMAAASLGLGSQWISDVGSPYMSTMLRTRLDIPDYFTLYDMTGIGYPAGPFPRAQPRRPLDEIVHFERYDRTKERDADQIEQFLVEYTRLGWGDRPKDAVPEAWAGERD